MLANSQFVVRRFPLRALLSALMCLALSSPVLSADLKLATWNLEHLAEKTNAGCNPRSDEDYEALRSYANQLNADVVAFQEVESVAAAARVFDPDKYRIEISRQNLRAGYPCKRGDPAAGNSTKQLTGFAIKRSVQYRRNPDFEEVDVSDNGSLRNAVDLTLLGKKPLRLLAVHLKASCPGKAVTNSSDECRTLFKQQAVLEQKWIEPRFNEGSPFVLLGDFNRRLLSSGDDFLALTNDDDPIGLHLNPVQAAGERRCVEKFPDRIDHIVPDTRAAERISSGSLVVQTFEGGKALADHCAVSAIYSAS